MQLNLTKAQLKEVIDVVFQTAQAAAGVGHPIVGLVIGSVQKIADSEIDAIAAALGITQ